MAKLKLLLTVLEAASGSGTINFKISVESRDDEPLPQPYTTPVFRTFQQIAWLRAKLAHSFPDLLVPTLPDPPVEKLINDQDYIEQKRLQVERFLGKIGTRSEFVESEDVKWFLGSDMTFEDVVDGKRGAVMEFFNHIIKQNYERGFRIYRPGEVVQDNDQNEFLRRQDYVLLLELRFSSILDGLHGMIQAREVLGDNLTTLGDLSIESLHSKYRLGSGQDHRMGPENEERHRILDKEMQVFGALMDELGFAGQRQGRAETFFLGDVFLEYKATLEAVKAVMNNRTDRLVEFVNIIKQHNKKHAQVEKAKLRMHQTSQKTEVQIATQEEERAAQEVEAFRAVYADIQATVTQELVRFEKQKARDLRAALRDYVQVQLKYERQKLETAEKAIEKIRTGDYDVKGGISKQLSISTGVSRDPVQQVDESGEDDDAEGFVGTWVLQGVERLGHPDVLTSMGGAEVWQDEPERIERRVGGGYVDDFRADSRDVLRGVDSLSVGGL